MAVRGRPHLRGDTQRAARPARAAAPAFCVVPRVHAAGGLACESTTECRSGCADRESDSVATVCANASASPSNL